MILKCDLGKSDDDYDDDDSDKNNKSDDDDIDCGIVNICDIQSTLVISNSLILNNRISRSKNMVPVFYMEF